MRKVVKENESEMNEMEIEFRKKIKRFENEFNVNVVEIKGKCKVFPSRKQDVEVLKLTEKDKAYKQIMV